MTGPQFPGLQYVNDMSGRNSPVAKKWFNNYLYFLLVILETFFRTYWLLLFFLWYFEEALFRFSR